MLTLINTNRIKPAIGPLALDYLAGSAEQAGIDVEILDLCFEDDPAEVIGRYFTDRRPELVGVSFRNVDDSFWPGAEWFVPELKRTLQTIREATDAPIVLGGVGYSVFAERILEHVGADFGVRGDGETATISLIRQLRGARQLGKVPGLIWRDGERLRSNRPAWPDEVSIGSTRRFIDNRRYFSEGGQCGVETKRGCNRNCIFCADPLSKGRSLRLRAPREIADEVQSLLGQGIDVFHTCDSEFNIPRHHAMAVCEEFSRRSLAGKVRWYAYMSPVPFDAEFAEALAGAGCVGINFGGDSASALMLDTYQTQHKPEDIAAAVQLCRRNDIAVMIDLLLGGPGETPRTAAETIDFIKRIDPDCAGASLGVRVYRDTGMEAFLAPDDPSIRRKYSGPIDLLKPTFYISEALGRNPAQLVRDLIDGDERFFEPQLETDLESAPATDHNYNANDQLVRAIAEGARGAYWDILRHV